MEVFIEVVILDNMFFNICLLHLVTMLWLPRPKRARLLLGAAVGTAYAVIAPLRAFYFLQHIAFKILVSAAMILVVYGKIDAFDFIKRLVSFYAMAALTAGALYFIGGLFFTVRVSGGLLFLSGPPLWLLLLCGAAIVKGAERAYLALKRGAGVQASQARISVRVGSRTVVVQALIDTGSSLHDPVSGLPIVLLPNEHMKRLYPEGCGAVSTGDIHFKTVAGSGSVRAMKSDEILLYQGAKVKRLEALIATAVDLAQPVAIVPADATLSF